MKKARSQFPKGWNQARVQRVLHHYECQSDEEATAEDEGAWRDPKFATMSVPVELVPDVQRLIAKRSG